MKRLIQLLENLFPENGKYWQNKYYKTIKSKGVFHVSSGSYFLEHGKPPSFKIKTKMAEALNNSLFDENKAEEVKLK